MASIATLTIDLVGKSAKLTAELKKANKSTNSWATNTRKMVGGSAKIMTGFGLAAVAALTAIYAKNAEFIDQQAKTADRLGITTQALSGLQHAANINGATNDELTKSLQRMQVGLGQVAQTGTGEAKYALDGLGLSIEQIKGLAPEEQFKLIADRLKNVEDQSQKVYIAQSLMGKSGVKMINLMNNGSEGIAKLTAEAEILGIAFTRIDAAKVEMANDSFDRAKKTTQSFGIVLATETAPIIAELTNMWTDSAKEAGGFGEQAKQVISLVATGIGYLADSAHGVKIIYQGLKVVGYEVVNFLVQDLAKAANVAAALMDAVGIESSSLKSFKNFAIEVKGNTAAANIAFNQLLSEPIPSEKIKGWIADAQAKFEAAAKDQVNNGNKKTDLSSLLLNDDEKGVTASQQKLIDSARNQYQQLFDAQLEMEGKEVELENRRYNRKLKAMQDEFALLEEKNLVTADIEQEYRIAKEQLEAQHKNNLKQENNDFWASYTESIRNTAMNTDQLWADSLTNFSRNVSNSVTEAIFEWEGFGNLAENIAESFGRSMVSSLVEIGTQRLVLFALEKSLGKASTSSYVAQVTGQAQAGAHLAAINAFASTAAIPIVGPGLAPGAAAAAEGITQPLAAAATLAATSSLASFEGGGYTGDGARIGGVDGKGGMYAIVHPQETVVDHTKGQSVENTRPLQIHYHTGDSIENVKKFERRSGNKARRKLLESISRPV